MKKKKRRKKWPVVVGILMGLFILAAGAVVLFRTRTVEVEGNSIYSENTIATWVQKDKLSVNTLYLLVKYNFLDSELPVGVEQMDVSLKNPWTVHVKVEEKELAGYVDCSGTYLYFDQNGIAVLKTKKQIEDAPYIEGLTFDESDVEIGKTLPVEDDSIFGKIVDASRYLKKYSLAPDRISCVEGDVRLYFGIVEVLLGDGGYEEKLQQVEPILDKLAELYPKTAGTLHLENYDSASDAISFVPAG
ncbi:cell division protein FtsQ [Mediterraneibacter catenae]|jgi:cell division protein FtsQ|uniref:Cell division protein FtsQ n=1 Tax=Mediterraneibacter catenae TaxID=2594882 RepID=A0A5M9HXX2_9FIRM|nr:MULTISPECIES: cell division protein FtsQ [Mediterraneibacter]OUO25477.1 cell division protein FtsQ [Lachnoclostridium sp. An298]HJA20019.1 cell division protein FtsQ [Candidatus Mediterraneibacter ornithocaccae]KAA8500346.1 cell division protein FtsQ [Mediterraneibacter catenae]MCF2569952.1 cell division protein FtsQ [Mediterraneibacter glycyrrhizinilyticus]MDN0060344.1 cell division protein FtsQ [Mediterraneibacter glycyrrhizinilyticus]